MYKCLGVYNHQQQEIGNTEMCKSLSSGKLSNIVSKENTKEDLINLRNLKALI